MQAVIQRVHCLPRPVAIVLGSLLLAACSGDGSTPAAAERSFDFQSGDQGFVAGFADYPEGEEDFYELDSGWEPVPGLEGRNGYMLNGNNHSDDLFMFLKRRIDGLAPNTLYDLEFTLELATREGSGCAGIGGAPGESVYVKAGMAPLEPEASEQSQGFLRMNIDKGNQSQGGEHALVVGDMAGPTTACDQSEYALKTLDSEGESFTLMSDAAGEDWLIVGTDSGFEGTTRVYFTRIEITATPRNAR